jgi:hypothetical protein
MAFVLDRRYSGYQDGATAHMRLQYTIRGTISDAAQGSQAKREIDLVDKNLTEVSVVSDMATLHRTSDVKTQASCKWIFGKKPCDYVPTVIDLLISNVANNDPSAAFYIFTVLEVDNVPEFVFGAFDPLLFRYGTVEFLDGDNSGYILPIRLVEYQNYDPIFLAFELLFAAPYRIVGGTQIRVTQGCNKSLTQCITYGQKVNFGGQPYIPGNGIFLRGTNYRT